GRQSDAAHTASLALTGLRRLRDDFAPLTDLVGASTDDGVAVRQHSEDFDQIADPSSAYDIHPLRDPVLDAHAERPLRCGDDPRIAPSPLALLRCGGARQRPARWGGPPRRGVGGARAGAAAPATALGGTCRHST